MSTGSPQRCRVRVTGTVQGVGFRPFVFRHAVRLGLTGFVRNDSTGVLLEVQGPPGAIGEMCRVIVEAPPPLALVTSVSPAPVAPVDGEAGFVITDSSDDGTADVPVSVDTGTCAECLAEVDDPGDRRFGYPFTNCTNCGPRYTIVVSVPYDRPATTMAGFEMCDECQREYDDPGDRRFHAQPNACPRCGPSLSYLAPDGTVRFAADDALSAAVDDLVRGDVVAIKGVGGFHLAADATSPTAVAELRRRKARDDKPFAVMAPDLPAARAMVDLSGPAEELLTSARRPIVLARRRERTAAGGVVAPGVAPGLAELGVMLPYTALHHLLMGRVARPLVLTSGNLSDDPIAYTDDDAVARLGPMVDGILTHDRPIHIRCDDSVVRAAAAPRGSTQVLRRSRGFAPEPIELGFCARRPVLALGAELKSTVSVAKGRSLVASHHIGDLEHLATYRSFVQAVGHLCGLCGVVPELVAHDMHPEYLSTKLAADMDLPLTAVQHHHAHVASCLVDHHHLGPVLGVAYDGLGFGDDGTLWGGELLIADLDGYERVGHLRAVGLAGGAAAIREPWRMAVAWARAACGAELALEVGTRLDPRTASLIAMLDAPGTLKVPVTTSMGRLFDAVAALTTGRTRVSYEGQAAIELEALAGRAGLGGEGVGRYVMSQTCEGGSLIMDPAPLVRAVLDDLSQHTPTEVIAAAFHDGVAAATVKAAAALAREHGLGTVALTGGVFQNARLSSAVQYGLVEEGLEVLVHRNVPPNDGGISIGQAAIAAHRAESQSAAG